MAGCVLTELYSKHLGKDDAVICGSCFMGFTPDEIETFEGERLCPFCDEPIND